jgi:hypothetical protein
MSKRNVGAFNFHNISSICTSKRPSPRHLSAVSQRRNADSKANESNEIKRPEDEPKKESAMGRRLSEMTEQAMLEGGRSARRNMEHAGFSDDLKKELEERIAAAAFRSEHATAHAIASMPVCSDLKRSWRCYLTF